MPGGRPSKLTPERQTRLVQAIADGHYYETACQLAGIEYQTFRNWMTAGEAGNGKKFVEFFEAIKKAEAEAENANILAIRAASRDSWQASAWLLERRHPDRWGKQDKLDLKQSGKVAVEHGVDADSANALLAALGLGPVGSTEPGDPSDGTGGGAAPAAD